jgi:hypothetical protein
MARPPFNPVRAAFLLLAFVVGVEVLVTVFVAGGCFWLILSGQYSLGSCRDVTTQIREVWAEALAAVLALIIATRPPPPPSDG